MILRSCIVRCLGLCFLILPTSVQAGIIGFDIQLSLSGFTASQEAIFNAAASTWEGYISGYRDTVASTVLSITGSATTIDGVGGILGSAGPQTGKFGPEHNFLYSASGAMNFDSADIANLEVNGTLSAVILHEMAHVMGIGTLWSSSAVGAPGFQELYTVGTGQYTGLTATAAWRSEFNQPAATFVPVELGGGSGTANSHWNEVDGGAGDTGFISNITGQDFKYELMTGWLNPGPTYISTVTLGSFVDLGYTLNSTTAVPEPSSLAFIGILVTAGLYRNRRQTSRKQLVI